MERGSGILLHITSLPSAYGIGDLGREAYAFVDSLHAARQRYWQILPLTPPAAGCGFSPYFSSSAFAGNPLLIDPEQLAADGLVTAHDTARLSAAPLSSVDFDGVTAAKTALLENAFDTFTKENRDRAWFNRFCAEQASWLDDFTVFLVTKERFGGAPWWEWPASLKNRDANALQAIRHEHGRAIERLKFFQFLFVAQWQRLKNYSNAKGVLIVGDMPIYVGRDSADVWANPGIFKLDADKNPVAVSGVPPDYFSATGQLWNTPVYDWNVLRATGFDWWKQRMRTMFAGFDVVRIDHFRGLVQYWEVPAGEQTAINGRWAGVPTHEFFDTLRAAFPHVAIIAEDLGIITDDVRAVMAHYRFPGMKVLQFAFGEDNPRHPYLPHNYERNCLVYTGTHDNNTSRGWLENDATAEEKKRLFAYLGQKRTAENAVWDLIRMAMMSVADVVITPMQDLLCLDASARMNTPAKTFGNWGWKLVPGQMHDAIWEQVKNMTEVYGRAVNG